MVPFKFSFIENEYIAWEVFDGGVDLFFVSDMVMTFFTPYLRDNVIVRSYTMITNNYLTGWFLIDLLAVLPFRHFLPTKHNQYSAALRIAKLPRLYRMVSPRLYPNYIAEDCQTL